MNRFVYFLLFLVILVGVVLVGVRAVGAQPAEPRRVVMAADLTGVIGPAAAHHVADAIARAEQVDAEALVLRINTPGGLATSMREIIADMLASQTPVIAFVWPPGGHAASAGTYILYAAHVAAMAPGTNLGAATPVQIGGLPSPPAPRKPAADKDEDPDADGETGEPLAAPADATAAKGINDAAAYIRSLAELRGRNADWAEAAVRSAESLSAEAAFERDVIDVMADDLPELLRAVDGRVVEGPDGERVLRTAELRVEEVEPTLVTKLLAVIANPNVAFLLMMLGFYGLFFELANPGVGPGVPGVICLVLGLYALNQLPLDYAGLALVALGLAFMVAEALTPSVGILGVGGVAAFAIGAAMLIDTDVPEYQLSWSLIAVMTALSGAVMVFLFGFVWRAHRRPVRTGRDDLIGARANVLDWADGAGHVWSRGERWEAASAEPLAPGDVVEILAVDGLVLRVVGVAAHTPSPSSQ